MQHLDIAVLQQLRAKTRLSQHELALKLGCDRTTVVRWEKMGHIKDVHLAALMKLAEEASVPATASPPEPSKTAEEVHEERMVEWLTGPPHPWRYD